MSELAAPEFADCFMTFSEHPTWFQFSAGLASSEKLEAACCAHWGSSTDFGRAVEMILNTTFAAKLKPCDIPELIVFSDMQFVEVNNNEQDDRDSSQEAGGMIRCCWNEGLW